MAADLATGPEQTVQWLARAVEAGLSRVYTERLAPCADAAEPALHEVDQVLEQVKAIGRHGQLSHVECARLGNDLIVVVDPAPQYDWVLPAVQGRLLEKLASLRIAIEPARTQLLTLTPGKRVRLLGFELRAATQRNGRVRVHYHRVTDKAPAEVPKAQHEQTRSTAARVVGLGQWLLAVAGRSNRVFRLSARARAPQAAPGVSSWRPRANRAILGLAGALLLGFLGWLFFAPPTKKDFLRYEEFIRPSGDEVNYAMYVPADYDRARRYPMIVFLHGYGERGTDGRSQCTVGILLGIRQAIRVGKPFDFIVLFPHGPSGVWLARSDDSRLVMELIDHATKTLSVDPDRIYLTGLSNGGTGTWNLAAEYPDRWAAIVPVCGFPSASLAPHVQHIPCWCFHGGEDRIAVPRGMIAAVEKAGGKPRFTEIPRMQHPIWNQVYTNKELYKWLAEQRRPRQGREP